MRRTWLVVLALALLGALTSSPVSAADDGTTTQFKNYWTFPSWIKRNVYQGEDAYFDLTAESSAAGHLTVTITQVSTGAVVLDWAQDTPGVAEGVRNQYQIHVPSRDLGAYSVNISWNTPFDPATAGPFTHLTLSPIEKTWNYTVEPAEPETPEVEPEVEPLTTTPPQQPSAMPTAVRVRIAGKPVVGKTLAARFRLTRNGERVGFSGGVTGIQRWTIGSRTVGRLSHLDVRRAYAGKRLKVTFVVRLPGGKRLTDTAAVRIASL